MAWTYAYPGASQSGGGEPKNFTTYRNMRGQAQFRFTDISVDGGVKWYSAYGHIFLIDNTGQVLGERSISKTWGVASGFTNLGYISGNRLVRMQVSMHVINSAGRGYFNTWKSELRWNNATPV